MLFDDCCLMIKIVEWHVYSGYCKWSHKYKLWRTLQSLSVIAYQATLMSLENCPLLLINAM